MVLAGLVAAGGPGASMRMACVAVLCCSLATLVTTAGIYDCLRTIRAWNNGYVLPTLTVAALLSGAGWLWLLLALDGWQLSPVVGVALASASLVLGALKLAYWRFIDRIDYSALGTAVTGLGAGGRVRPAEAPHTEANFLLREMGYVLARRHARRLRWLSLGAIAGVPLLAMAAAQLSVGGEAILALLGVVAQMTGLFIERWLFFAQARHVVTGYYR
jgi:DMSO reductase anchor subunit